MTAVRLRGPAALLAALVCLAGPTGGALEGQVAEARTGKARRAAIQKQKQHAKTRQAKAERRALRQKKKASAQRRAAALPRPATQRAGAQQAPRGEAAALAMTAPRQPQQVEQPVVAAPGRASTPRTRPGRTASRSRAPRGTGTATSVRPSTTAPRTGARAAVTSSRPAGRVALDASRPVTLAQARGTSAVRETVAMEAVAERLRGQGGAPWEVSTALDQFVGDVSNPITGSGPIEIRARQQVTPRGAWARVRHAFSGNAERRFMVMVDPGGVPTILSSEPNSAPYRALRFLTRNVPIRELVSDTLRSSGVRNGIGLSLGGVGIAAVTGPVGWAGAGMLLYRGMQLMGQGVERRQVARRDAVSKTVAQVKRQLRKGETVTFTEAYRTYRVALEKIKPGTTPQDLRSFAAELSVHGL